MPNDTPFTNALTQMGTALAEGMTITTETHGREPGATVADGLFAIADALLALTAQLAALSPTTASPTTASPAAGRGSIHAEVGGAPAIRTRRSTKGAKGAAHGRH